MYVGRKFVIAVMSVCLSVCPTSSWNIRVLCCVWARDRCRISLPRILAECRKKRLNQASVLLLCFVLFCFFWVLLSFSNVCFWFVFCHVFSSVYRREWHCIAWCTIKNLLTHSPRYCVEAAKLITDFSCHVLQIIHIHTRYRWYVVILMLPATLGGPCYQQSAEVCRWGKLSVWKLTHDKTFVGFRRLVKSRRLLENGDHNTPSNPQNLSQLYYRFHVNIKLLIIFCSTKYHQDSCTKQGNLRTAL